MNPVTGYLPVWLSSARHDEYLVILSKHYNVEYFDFEELAPLATIIPPYMYITAKRSGSIGYAHFCSSLSSQIWSSFASQVYRRRALSLMKLK